MGLDVLLVNPPYQGRTESIAQVSVGPPLGLAYVASALEAAGSRVAILDANALGLGEGETVRRALDASPRVLGLTAVTPTADLCGRIAAGVKAEMPEVATVLGGVHASVAPDETLARLGAIDALVRGEGESAMPELARALARGPEAAAQVRGVSLRSRGRAVHAPPRPPAPELDALPFPALHLLPMERYRAPESGRMCTIIGVRGCPGRCTYCACPLVFGRTLRSRSPGSVADEVERDRSRFGVELVSFLDDTFAVDRRWAIDVCSELVRRGLHREVRWKALTRADTVDRELVSAMRRAGCVLLEVGIESGSQRILDAAGKGVTVAQVREAFRIAREGGLPTMGFVMLGLPGETEGTLAETAELVRSLDADYLQVSFATPYPGTKLHRWARERGLLRTEDWERYVFLNETVMSNPTAPPELLRVWWVRLNRSFYLRPGYLARTAARAAREGSAGTMLWAGAKALRHLAGRG